MWIIVQVKNAPLICSSSLLWHQRVSLLPGIWLTEVRVHLLWGHILIDKWIHLLTIVAIVRRRILLTWRLLEWTLIQVLRRRGLWIVRIVLKVRVYRQGMFLHLHLLWHERIVGAILHRLLSRILVDHRRVVLLRKRRNRWCHRLLVKLVVLRLLRAGETAGVVGEKRLRV